MVWFGIRRFFAMLRYLPNFFAVLQCSEIPCEPKCRHFFSFESNVFIKDKINIFQSFKDVCANCFCASLLRTTACATSHATSCIKHARQVLKWTMIGQLAIAKALLGFNDLGLLVPATFLFRNRFYLQLSPHCSKMSKKSMWEVKRNSRFLSTTQGILPSCGCKARETIVAKCELVLWGASPVDKIGLIGPFKPYLTENISFQSSNCNILGFAATVAFFANVARFTQI